MNADSAPSAAKILRELFGENRAEWAPARLKEFFVSPAYLQKLESMRPCFLVGGRGTGKTTSLQSLRFDSCLERLEGVGLGFGDQEYVGVLVRMNKNRMRAFQGSQFDETHWSKLFAHYFNLLVCLEMASLALWLQQRMQVILSSRSVERVARDLGVAKVGDLVNLQCELQQALSLLELQVNNPRKEFGIVVSIAEAPIRTFADVLNQEGLLGDRVIFCCIDEFENLLASQQEVLNTYVKHSAPPISYKIGVRKNGIRSRRTLDGQDLLKTPDDYAEIEIADEGFEFFAQAVADLRLKIAKEQVPQVAGTLAKFLDELSFSEEAELLGARKVADRILEELKVIDVGLYAYFEKKPKTETYFLKYWQESEGASSIGDLAKDWKDHESEWQTRLGNYGFASLFWLSRGNKGARIKKYYCGQRVFLALAGGNIRYFLELIDSAITHEMDNVAKDYIPESLSPKSQTLAARDVGARRINQIEGLADHGVQLKRLVLAVGKVFFELARTPLGRTPEVTSFVLTGLDSDLSRIHELLLEGVGHLAFEVAPRTKPTSNVEVKDDEFRLHRIFSAFFEMSHRKKRRITFNARDLVGVLDDHPSSSISALLENRKQSLVEELPEQLAFFSAFYDGNDRAQ